MDSSIDLSQNELKRVRVSLDEGRFNMHQFRKEIADNFSNMESI
jgi:hypothetical protein